MQATLTGADLSALLAPMPSGVVALTRRVVAMIATHPGVSGRVVQGWKSINFRRKQGELICAVVPENDSVSLYFEQALHTEPVQCLAAVDPAQVRKIVLKPQSEIPLDTIGLLLAEAIALFP